MPVALYQQNESETGQTRLRFVKSNPDALVQRQSESPLPPRKPDALLRQRVGLTLLLKKALKQGFALLRTDAGEYGGAVAVILREKVNDAAAGAGVLLSRAEDDAGDSGVQDRAGAHGAGFQRDIETASVEPPVAERRAGFADGFHLGVSRSVMRFPAAIAAAADDMSAGVRDDAADGDFSLRGCFFRKTQGFLHQLFTLHSAHGTSPWNHLPGIHQRWAHYIPAIAQNQ